MRTIIATIVTGPDEREWLDMELPAEIPVGRIAVLTADALRGEVSDLEMVQFSLEQKRAEGEWQTLEQDKSLEQQLVCDGAYLRVQRGFSTVDTGKPLNGWRSLFDTVRPFALVSSLRDEDTEPQPGYVWKLLE
ncbi:hypothetical protein [Brevibacillus fulvus]|uniref:Uncharacterized protein n=1 Tax=Brevibacillus fulvus TaxID=1125967 RepID=A0A938XZM0_9BACL|nr:hypothetical protein [Brevibacillus fulvus]MBM7589799.1 hypothetical protein [Brevibacillus fulvus]